MTMQWRTWLCAALASGCCLAEGASPGAAAASTGTVETTICLARGKWDTNRWTAVRMANQERAVPMVQFDDSIGTATNTFSGTDYGKERDNALLMYDTGFDEGEVEVTFALGWGFHGSSSPGICLSPTLTNGVFASGIGVFVANYAMVAWYEYTVGDRIRYAHIGQLARWTDPAKRHVLRYRYSRKQNSIALQLDDSDVMVFQFVGDLRLSYVPLRINSLVALWGCHGASNFYEVKVRQGGTLPFLVRERPAGK